MNCWDIIPTERNLHGMKNKKNSSTTNFKTVKDVKEGLKKFGFLLQLESCITTWEVTSKHERALFYCNDLRFFNFNWLL